MAQLNVPKKLTEVVRQGNKEKVLRVALMCQQNILTELKLRDAERYAATAWHAFSTLSLPPLSLS